MTLTSSTAAPSTTGIPAEVSREALRLLGRGRVPALSLAVTTADRTAFAAGFGTADLAQQSAATAHSAYLWFSMTKVVTATAALQLVDEGRLELDAPAGRYVDALQVPGRPQPTVRQLLDHTSGLANPLPLRWVHPADAPGPDPAELLRSALARRRAFRQAPGGRARYSNVGYLALGEVIAAAAGRPYEEHVTQAVLSPAGMTRTGFGRRPGSPAAVGHVRAPRVADPVLRRVLPAGVVGARTGRHLGLRPFAVDGPAYGGLVGDVLDAARFVRLHLRDGELDGRRVLRPATARAMRVVDRPGRPFTHGLGWFRSPGRGSDAWVEHWGAGAGFWNVMRLHPDRGVGVVLMTNSTAKPPFDELLAAALRSVT